MSDFDVAMLLIGFTIFILNFVFAFARLSKIYRTFETPLADVVAKRSGPSVSLFFLSIILIIIPWFRLKA